MIKQIAAVVHTLYHGTCEESACQLLTEGWRPNRHLSGGNAGQTKFLYLTTEYEDARWFSNEKGCDVVLKLTNVPQNFLIVDPEDGTGVNVQDEISSKFGLPGKVCLTKPLPADYFSRIT